MLTLEEYEELLARIANLESKVTKLEARLPAPKQLSVTKRAKQFLKAASSFAGDRFEVAISLATTAKDTEAVKLLKREQEHIVED